MREELRQPARKRPQRAGGSLPTAASLGSPFGFDRVLREQGREVPLTPQEMLERSLVLAGTPDSVSRQLERLLDQTPVRWLFAWTYNGLVPHDKIMRSLELFATKVLPRFAGDTG